MNKKIIIKGGNAYRLQNGSLQSCAVLADDRVAGELDPGEWYEVTEPTPEAEEARRELSS
jgi:hypothetical protein